ncbi:hypothetical protein [Dendrosporobacter sp. 1207_IL3150]|uniref:hypothetical protein n=1 Tax=Dendrosporobacter sp. 1207_IL3150 TaxID=3084054 RepID=UPI002FDB2522
MKNKMLFAILLVTLAVVFIAGCGSTDKKSSPATTKPATQNMDHTSHTPEQMKEHNKQ